MNWDYHTFQSQPAHFIVDLVYYFSTLEIIKKEEEVVQSSLLNMEMMARQYGHSGLRG